VRWFLVLLDSVPRVPGPAVFQYPRSDVVREWEHTQVPPHQKKDGSLRSLLALLALLLASIAFAVLLYGFVFADLWP
jgi:hypothetical protein